MDYSIAIGIDKYLDSKLNKTPYAENDAEEYCRIMGNVFILQENIKILGSNATRVKIEDCIKHLQVQ